VAFNDLIMSHPSPLDTAVTYDKMKLFLQREGNDQRAIIFGVFSFLSQALAYYQMWQKDLSFPETVYDWAMKEKHGDKYVRDGPHSQSKKLLDDYISKESIEDHVLPLLEEAEREELLKAMCELLLVELKKIPKLDFQELDKRIGELLKPGQ
jgi:hypothetical protein